jgi:Tol biopolymer transport system component
MLVSVAASPMPPANDRLNSWKEIASYLNRGARTVQRWEREEGLPVHRLQHQKHGSVYASKSELDAWWESRKPALEEAPATNASIWPGGRLPRKALWGASLALIALLAGVAAWWFAGRYGKQPATWKVVPLTTYPGYEGWPSFSPDGNQVAFGWTGPEHGPMDIYVKLIGKDHTLRLTSGPKRKYSPVWSPDGTQIAFLRDSGQSRTEVCLVPALGGPERLVAEVNGDWIGLFDGYLAWSADGRWLITTDHATEDEPYSLTLLALDGREARRLTSPPQLALGDGGPAVSPDGRTLAFLRCSSISVCDLYSQALSQDLRPQGDPKRVTFHNSWVRRPMWTADGRAILYAYGEGGPATLWRVPPAGGRLPEISSPAGEVGFQATISRQGDRMAWVQGYLDQEIYRVEIEALKAGSESAVKIAPSTRTEFDAEVSPDGQRLAFISRRSGNAEVWVCNADGSSPVQLTSFGGPHVTTPRWSPDGLWIAFDARVKANGDIYVVGASGGQARRLTTEPSEDGLPAWSRDGKWIYFSSSLNAGAQIWKIPAEGGTAIQLTQQGGVAPTESADGAFLFYMKPRSGGKHELWRIPSTGGEEIQIIGARLGLQKFALVKDGVYFVEGNWRDSVCTLQFHRFSTGRTEQAGVIRRRLDTGLGVWPTDQPRWLYYSAFEEPTGDLMLADSRP